MAEKIRQLRRDNEDLRSIVEALRTELRELKSRNLRPTEPAAEKSATNNRGSESMEVEEFPSLPLLHNNNGRGRNKEKPRVIAVETFPPNAPVFRPPLKNVPPTIIAGPIDVEMGKNGGGRGGETPDHQRDRPLTLGNLEEALLRLLPSIMIKMGTGQGAGASRQTQAASAPQTSGGKSKKE